MCCLSTIDFHSSTLGGLDQSLYTWLVYHGLDLVLRDVKQIGVMMGLKIHQSLLKGVYNLLGIFVYVSGLIMIDL